MKHTIIENGITTGIFSEPTDRDNAFNEHIRPRIKTLMSARKGEME